MKTIETIKDKKNNIIAIIVYKNFRRQKISFFTPPDFSQQLASISRKAGDVICAHTHNVVKRDIHLTQETLFIKKGKVKVNFYDKNKNYLENRILQTGDVILLASGGHGFEILKDAEIIEVKQGPYLGEEDKTRFKGIEK